jgi:hypothetical protein
MFRNNFRGPLGWTGTINNSPFQYCSRGFLKFLSNSNRRVTLRTTTIDSTLWVYSEVEDLIVMADEAFKAWARIRTDPMAGNYLLAMLLKKR